MIHDRRQFLSRGLLCATFGLSLTLPAWAELPPHVYEQMQKEAPEALTIQVLTVSDAVVRTNEGRTHQIRASARVTSVERTATGLKVDQKIRLAYTRFEPKQPIAGPSQPPLLTPGKSCPAFLKYDRRQRAYDVAAGGFSFERVEPPAPEK